MNNEFEQTDLVPDECRPTPVSHEELAAAIRATVPEFIGQPRVARVEDIGNGYCYEFAEMVFKRLGAYRDYVFENGTCGLTKGHAEDFWKDDFSADLDAWRKAGETVPDDVPPDRLSSLLGEATHEWIILDGRHYDAEAPGGAERILDLPFFARQIEALREDFKTTPGAFGR